VVRAATSYSRSVVGGEVTRDSRLVNREIVNRES
jgi:hypothetical protein